mmetsp:Transcript_157/g.336  ORF Transcript_157/g.336 Transcript_157/m.336 type:complete len:505 (-) Transcript_157:293-1807(-)|eukprot:CAMPEP_0197584554 /NCGR_PEP_ID=MMETSP1326-20131121/7134_1 /TAXON_ID=1155430 /ORGANISM="Genus nov. species nov., Strain RCC2288" /LENGTH=504 /DNA_ID=CAMNT_0043148939 /DNA_START=151 /DNA_END=1665 /DNA_ORIENTATION=-
MVLEMKKGDAEVAQVEAVIVALKEEAAQPGQLSAVIEKMLAHEKTYRLQADFSATPRFCVAILSVLHRAADWKGINEHIVLLSKRRAQLKQALGAMVKEAMSYVDKAPTLAVKTELIETLNTVTSGKIFVEVEKARLTRMLAKIKEEEGKVEEAAEIMQEVAVETYGALSKHEKIFFIEEQVRLCLDKKDFIRAQILSRKINPKAFDEIVKADKKAAVAAAQKAGEDVSQMDLDSVALSAEEAKKEEKQKNAGVDHADGYFEETDPSIPPVPELKLKYYHLMIRYHSHSNEYLEICRCYQNLMECEGVKEGAPTWTPVLKKVVWFVALAPYDSMQQSLMHTIAKDSKLSDLPLHKQLMKQFTTKEIIHWDTLAAAFESEMAAEADIFGGAEGEKRRADLRLRVIEHNLLVIGAYYSRISLARLAELLCLPGEETEKHLSDLVTSKKVSAKIDRPGGVVDFRTKAQGADWLLNAWVGKIDKLLSTLDKSNHLIHKEAMAHKVSLD